MSCDVVLMPPLPPPPHPPPCLLSSDIFLQPINRSHFLLHSATHLHQFLLIHTRNTNRHTHLKVAIKSSLFTVFLTTPPVLHPSFDARVSSPLLSPHKHNHSHCFFPSLVFIQPYQILSSTLPSFHSAPLSHLLLFLFFLFLLFSAHFPLCCSSPHPSASLRSDRDVGF